MKDPMNNEQKKSTGLKALKETLSGMTYKEKLQHLWTYYRWRVIIVSLSLIAVLSLTLTITKNMRVNIIIGGVSLNVDISEEGEAYLRSGYKDYIGSESKDERVSFTYFTLQNPMKNPNASVAENSQNLDILLALCSNHEIDYLITDREAFEILVSNGVCADLTQIYSAQELEAMSDLICYYQPEGSTEQIPVAINILNTPFIQDNTNAKEIVYFIFVSNSNRLEQARGLYDYLLAWPAKK